MKFTALISVYGRESPSHFITALNSIVNQSVPPTDVVLVQDGPVPEEIHAAIDEFRRKQANVIMVTNEENLGLSASLNKGFMYCNRPYVARMDSDDICEIDRFRLQSIFMKENPGVDILGSWATVIDRDGIARGVLKRPLTNEAIRKYIWTCPLVHPTVMYRTAAIKAVGGYNVRAGPRQDDYDLWFRCAHAGLRFANIRDRLLRYRYDETSLQKNDLRVGWARLITGLRWSLRMRLGVRAYIGVCFPLFRSCLPPYLSKRMERLKMEFDPRLREPGEEIDCGGDMA